MEYGIYGISHQMPISRIGFSLKSVSATRISLNNLLA